MRNPPKVSIVVPVYNAEAYLVQALQSLREQTLRDIEVIMVNDGSTDGSEGICRDFAEQDDRFLLINQENGGAAAARRTGMLAVHGEYIGFIDADDWCEPDMYERLYTVGHSGNVDIVCCNYYMEKPGRRWLGAKHLRDGYYDRKQIEDEILPRTLGSLDSEGESNAINWANWIRIFKRSLIEAHGIYNDPRFRRCQDLQITFEATLHAQSYFYLGDAYLYHCRLAKNSLSRGYTVNQWEKLRILIERLYADVDQFTDLDLHKQMDLCAFFFAAVSCENEGRKCASVSRKTRDDHIMAICEDPLCRHFVQSLSDVKFSEVNQMYYEGIKNRSLATIKKANRMNPFERRKRKVIRIILKIPGVSALRDLLRKAD